VKRGNVGKTDVGKTDVGKTDVGKTDGTHDQDKAFSTAPVATDPLADQK
jgi:hypothetical protein